MFRGKVFFIGFPKTGTTSVKLALRQLGLKVCGLVKAEPGWGRQQLWERAAPLIPRFDAFQNCPWATLYRELSDAHPESKFVLTYRTDERWINSVAQHFGGRSTVMREIVFGHGDPAGHEAQYLEVYRRHNAAVREHFRGCENFLEFGLTQGDGWEQLCPFLEMETPNRPFPHANRRVIQKFWERWWSRKAA